MNKPNFDILRKYNATTAYDIFYDKGTYYSGLFVAAARYADTKGSAERAKRYWQQSIFIDKQRNDINPDDIEAMISTLEQWASDAANICFDNGTDVAGLLPYIRDAVSDQQFSDIFEHEIKQQVFGMYTPSDNPVSVFLGAQPAAGKTLGQLRVQRVYAAGTTVPIIGDDYRKFHPYYVRIMTESPLDMPDLTAYAAGRWTGMCVRHADKNSYSDIIEGTWRSSDTVINEAKTASSYGRRCHAVIIAVPPALSRIGFLSRYYAAFEMDGNARWTPPTAHETTIANLENTMREISASGLFENYSAIKRDGSVLYDGDDAGEWIERWKREFSRTLIDEERKILEAEIEEIMPVCAENTPELIETVASICDAARY